MKNIVFIASIAAVTLEVTAAHAQMASQPWGFQPQNRASIAALIKQAEDNNRTNVGATPSVTNLVCGSDGKSSASGNSTCVILNNAAGEINVGQDSEGSQNANSSTSETQVQAQSNSDAVLATLQGKSTAN